MAFARAVAGSLMSVHRELLAGLVVAWAVVEGGPTLLARDHPPSAILSLHASGTDNLVSQLSETFLRRALDDSQGATDHYVEYLDFSRFPRLSYEDAVLRYLHSKYDGRGLDLVVANGDAVLSFVTRHRNHPLFAGVPLVFSAPAAPPFVAVPHATGVIGRMTLRESLDVALRVLPDTEHVAVVSGSSPFSGDYEAIARDEFKDLEGRVVVTYLSGLPVATLLERVATLPPRSILFFTMMFEDGEGRALSVSDTARRVIAASNAPVFTLFSMGMDEGIVGGRMLSTRLLAERLADVAARVLRGENPDSIPVAEVDWSVTEFDWRQLERWRISEAALPPGSTLLFKQRGVWELYRVQIVAGLFLLLFQTGLIAGLLVQRAQRIRLDKALDETRRRYSLATTAAGVGIWDWHLDTGQLFLDSTLKALLGFTDAEIPNCQATWLERVHPDDRAAVLTWSRACVADGPREILHRMVHKDQSVRWFLTRGSVLRGPSGARVVATSIDMTQHKHAEEQFRAAIEAAPVGMIMVDSQGKIVLLNAKVERMFGYTHDDLIDQPIEKLVPQAFREALTQSVAEFRQNSNPRLMTQGREVSGLRKDGSELVVEIALNPIRTARGEFVLGSMVDMTERKVAEREREYLMQELQKLSGRLIASQDTERARIARDLHDDTSQQLASLSIGLSAVKRRIGLLVTDEGLREEVSSLQHRTMELAEGVRNLSHDLHPGVLQHIGLPAALTTFCDDLRRQHPLTVELDMGGDFDRLSSDGALCLYRIAQEALRNVAQHAGAHHVEVTLRRAGDQVALSIADDGAGFDPTSTRLSGRGLGLVSMRERIRSMGGRIEITSDVGQGTRITAQIPVQSPTLA